MDKKLGRGIEKLFKDITAETPSPKPPYGGLGSSNPQIEGAIEDKVKDTKFPLTSPAISKPLRPALPSGRPAEAVVPAPVPTQIPSQPILESPREPSPPKTFGRHGEPINPPETTGEVVMMVNTEQLIANRFQPRKTFDKESLAELIESIKSAGVLQPILVRKSPRSNIGGQAGPPAETLVQAGNYYEIVAGERRWRACLELKIPSIPVIIKEVDDQKMLEWALIENTQRKDLNPIERSRAYKELMTFFSLTQEEISRRVGLDRATISNFIRLLELPTEIQDELAKEAISTTHARSLLSINDPSLQIRLCQRIKKEGMSVRRLEYIIRWLKRRKPALVSSSSSAEQLHLKEIEERLMRKFNSKVTISTFDNKQGKVLISFYSIDDFQRILDKLDQIQ